MIDSPLNGKNGRKPIKCMETIFSSGKSKTTKMWKVKVALIVSEGVKEME